MAGTAVALLGNCTSMDPPTGTECSTVKDTKTSTLSWPTLSLFCEPSTCKLKPETAPLISSHLAAAVQKADCYAHWIKPRRTAWLVPVLQLLTSTASAIAGQIERANDGCLQIKSRP